MSQGTSSAIEETWLASAVPVGMPRPASKQPITMPYEALTAEALVAYKIDASYAVAMCAQASQILRKREVWSVRSELRAASAEAVAACSQQPAFTCSSPSPCGTSATCRFSSGQLALLDVPAKPGRATRPQPHESGPTYDIEAAVKPLVALRERPRRPT